MALHEIDLDASFEDLQKFATNILGEIANTAPASSQEIDIKLVYWQTQAQVHLTRKLYVAMDSLTTSVRDASQKATSDARRMVRATWGLVGGTILLALATCALVWYTRELVHVEREPASVLKSTTEVGVGSGPNP